MERLQPFFQAYTRTVLALFSERYSMRIVFLVVDQAPVTAAVAGPFVRPATVFVVPPRYSASSGSQIEVFTASVSVAIQRSLSE
jgi:hypothetical protein